MEMHINFWAVLLAGVASMAVGMIYYAQKVFGAEWMKLAKIDAKRFGREMPRIMPGVFVAALVAAYTIAVVSNLYHAFYTMSWIQSGVVAALVLWLGISVTTLFVHNALDQRPSRLTLISVGNRLASFLAMGLILGWLHP